MDLTKRLLNGAGTGAIYCMTCICFPVVLLLLCTSEVQVGKCGSSAAKETQKARMKQAWKMRQKNLPRPLPARRRDLSSDREGRPSGVENSRSPLLRLPLELRQQIFTEVLGGDTLHLIQLPKRLGHIRCTYQSENGQWDHARNCFPPGLIQTYHRYDMNQPPESTDTCIALLKVCRQIYRDASQILYQTNTFDINHPTTLLYLAITPHRLQSIRSLQITWTDPARWYSFARDTYGTYPDDFDTWNKMWTRVREEMTGLRRVYLYLQMDPEIPRVWPCEPGEFIDQVLSAPRAALSGLQDFRLEIAKSVYWPLNIENVQEKMRKDICKVA